jgi:integrase
MAAIHRHIKKYPEQRRERFLGPEEFGRLGAALQASERDGTENPAAIAAIRLLILTGCRMSEVLRLKWDYVDVKARELRLPDSKTGAKIVYFGKAAATVLGTIPRLAENPYVMSGKKPGAHLTDLEHPWQRIRARAKLGGVRLHDLRHSYASGALAAWPPRCWSWCGTTWRRT